MRKNINKLGKIIIFFKKNYWLFLLLIVAISYGQILQMLPWQDDNALFFKLAHIKEPAGYLGKGIFGEGPYKYTAFFYYPIYLLFGFKTIPYFSLSFVFYFISCLFVYKLFAVLINKNAGEVASFLYACGFIASDGYIRLYNSVGTSLSIILVCLLFINYFKFLKNKKNINYFLSVLFFFLAVEFIRYRTHYLLAIVIFFEIIFSKKNFLKGIWIQIVRLLPFLIIFYVYFVLNGDTRGQQVFIFLSDLFKGRFFNLYGFFSSISNSIIADEFINLLFVFQDKLILFLGFRLPIAFLSVIFLQIVFLYIFFKRRYKYRYLFLLSFFLSFIFIFLNRIIFKTPLLVLGEKELFTIWIGESLLLVSIVLFFPLEKKFRNIYLLLLFWFVVNVASYSAYNPLVVYASINRYLAHSFLALVGLLALLFVAAQRKKDSLSKLYIFLIISWGIINVYYSFSYQSTIIKNRTKPVKEFYSQLKKELPHIEKGDIIYFDVADDARGYFADAFSVAQMPETTAIAWRYGIDRYDFFMTESYDNFIDLLRTEKTTPEKIHMFFYSNSNGLSSTLDDFHKLNQGFYQMETFLNKDSVESYTLQNVHSCVLKPYLSFTVSAKPDWSIVNISDEQNFPFDIAQKYHDEKMDFYNNTKLIVSSDWQERVQNNLTDENADTVWQADRITWDEEKTFFGFDLGKVLDISRFVWINAFENQTPTNYFIETSIDGNNWKVVARVDKDVRIPSGKPQQIKFPDVSTRFIRMVIEKTLNEDSAGISEAWVVGSGFEGYDISELEDLISSPDFALKNQNTKISVLWLSNSSPIWQRDNTATFKLKTDGVLRSYKLLLPCKGTSLEKISLESIQYPIILNLEKIQFNYYPILK